MKTKELRIPYGDGGTMLVAWYQDGVLEIDERYWESKTDIRRLMKFLKEVLGD